MSMGQLVHLLVSYLALSFFTIPFLLMRLVLRLATACIQLRATYHSTSIHATCLDQAMQSRDANHGIAGYESASSSPGPKELVMCVFCLSDMEEGEEIRELGCKHLFHRGCFDRWLMHRHATCPLCRRETTAKHEEVEGEELKNAAVFLVCGESSLALWLMNFVV